ncbi:MAG: UDP-glucose 4-epimerase GalE [Alphaproteobacteria bacterium]
MGQTLLVTGGAGYVGSHTAAALKAAGHTVIVFDNLQQGHRQAVEAVGAELVVGDLADRDAVAAVFRRHKFDAVLHFASNALVGESMQKPFKYLGDNVTNALNLIEAMVAHDVRKIVLSSTCAIFGTPARVPIDEDVPVAPSNPYGESKYMIERLLYWADQVHGVRSAALRYFNAAGAHPDLPIGEDHAPESHLIPIAFEAALGQRPHVEVFGTNYETPDRTCVRDYIHVCDLADAHVRVLDVLGQRSCQYNLGTGRGYSVREVLDTVRRVTGIAFTVKEGPRRPGDPAVLVASSARIEREIGWRPRYTDLDGIVGTAWAWRKRHPRGYARPVAAE